MMMDESTSQDTLQTIAAMCQQEANGYKTCDFLYQQQQPLNTNSSLDENMACDPIDIDCRTKMAAWCYQVVDFCKFHRETVAIAMNILDRFMMAASQNVAAQQTKNDRKSYQLAAMTALYTAVKIHEPEAMDPKLVSTLSRGTYQPHEIEIMERQILMALTWRVNPPTAMAFVRQYMTLIRSSLFSSVMDLDASCVQDTIYDLTKFQTELAVSEYDFLDVHPSVVAFCALLNSIESVGIVSDKELEAIANTLSHAIGLQGDVSDIQMWLYQAVVQEPSAQSMFAQAAVATTTATTEPSQTPEKPCTLNRQESCEISPRSIAA